MPHAKRIVWISLCVVVLVGIAGLLTPPAVAQIRAALVRDVDSSVRGIRFIENHTQSFDTNQFITTETITPGIPPGKKLVLQSVSVHTFLTDGQNPMETRVSIDSLVVGYVDQSFQGVPSAGQRHFTGNLALNVVVEPGELIHVFQFRTDNAGSSGLNFFRVVLVGYLVDAA
jgi:hypothetical protein